MIYMTYCAYINMGLLSFKLFLCHTVLPPVNKKNFLEPMTGIEPVNLILTKDALYQLSYMGTSHPQIYTGKETPRHTGNKNALTKPLFPIYSH